jgi:hypothetical protein
MAITTTVAIYRVRVSAIMSLTLLVDKELALQTYKLTLTLRSK